MQRIVAALVHQAIGLHHERHIAGLHGNADIAEADVLEHPDVGKRAFDQRLRRGMAVFFQQGLLVRRLTPTECARLQGFPDNWCANLGTEKPSDEEMYFWHKVFKTYSEVTGCKMKSDKQVAKWLKDPYSDSAEYKMWGNGVALPCVWFVLCGIVWYAQSGGDNAPI